MAKATRRYLLVFMVSMAGAAAPLATAFAHFGLADGDDAGSGLFWVYGFVFAGVAGFIVYQKRFRRYVSPEQRTLIYRLRDLERALSACLTELKNGEDYPNQCGLTHAERQERLLSASVIREKIAELHGELAVS